MVERKQAMKTVYYRIFYCVFKGLKRSYREDGKTMTIISSIYLSILVYLNVYSILFIITIITKMKAYQIPITWLLIVLPVMNLILFLRNNNYLQILTLFDKEEKKVRIRRKTFCIIYIILTMVSFPVLFYIVGSMGLYVYVPK